MTEAPPESAMRRVQALLERAAHPETPDFERESCQEKADALMAQYRIEMAMLDFGKKKNERREVRQNEYKPLNFETVVAGNRDQEHGVSYDMEEMRAAVYRHTGCMVKQHWNKITVVGFESDIFFGDMIWASIMMDVVKNIFPGWSAKRSFDENVFELKQAGYSWPQIREYGLMNEAKDRTGLLTEKNAGSKLRAAYKREAERRGVVVLGGRQQPHDPGWYRRSFAFGYRTKLEQRLAAMKKANEPTEEKFALALIEDHDLVMQRFYELFPEAKPKKMIEESVVSKVRRQSRAKIRYVDGNAYGKGSDRANQVNLKPQSATGTGRAGELN